ncbi:flagellin biosynthesis protein FlgD [Polaribacter reichenbachii]|uniref:Flagellin biosynthesis protein FlgD n=1 Tax=Polaribacter reichenbachii TaxID=996801 RepID=A0A1B8U4Y3_9FLAO|nr:DUF2271 domain-containing protein [Polaribacter reichenbachii]APZ47996.1 flagellin biosynthesis protein FlgD [Polaribacter reichenbachii]AUC18630.1 flagellin biosynthesis protein FlgD [Polaribacter reichenbachii]OBY66925.1 flagellin biosynthesis protein FlgD [Polaribacter reichenbachii]
MKTKRTLLILPVVLLMITALFSFKKYSGSSPYKCMIQMKNYTGEGAYIVISLLNPEGKYEETLYVQGDDDEWYFDITEWWNFQGKKRADIDAITGATISGGERSISVIQIPDDKLNQGYKLRFETAVEDKDYYKDDVEFELTSDNIKSKIEGKGFIRYIRMIPQ